jgi:CheY-like chemotaxis protein
MLADIEKALVAGFHSYITKPINVDQFTNSVNEGLKFADK